MYLFSFGPRDRRLIRRALLPPFSPLFDHDTAIGQISGGGEQYASAL